MPPFSNDIDISFSSQEGIFDKTPVPLYEYATARTTPQHVSFAPMVVIYDVESTDDYTPDEIKASWFTIDDMRNMKIKARSQAKLLNSGRIAKDDIRGIEHKTRDGLMKKRLHRMGAYSAVFCEIEFQREEEIVDEGAIADAYRPYSEPCAVAAQLAGELDALEAIKIYRCT